MLCTAKQSTDTVKIDEIFATDLLEYFKDCQKQRSENQKLELTTTELANVEWIQCCILQKSKSREIHVHQFGLLFMDQELLKYCGQINNSLVPMESYL